MENKNIKKQVKKLAKQKKYNDIYVIYGQKWFKKYTPEEWQKKDKEKLRKEGKFIDIYIINMGNLINKKYRKQT